MKNLGRSWSVTTWLDGVTIQRLDSFCKNHCISRSAGIRFIVNDYLNSK